MHHINVKCQQDLFIDLSHLFITENRKLRCFANFKFQGDHIFVRVDRQSQIFFISCRHEDIVFIPQCHRQLFDMNLCAADVVECPFLEIQMQQIENVLLSVVQLCIHIDIVADLLIRIFHTVQMVHPHLGSVTVI